MIFKPKNSLQKSFTSNSLYLYLSYFADYFLAIIFLPFIARAIGAVELGVIGVVQGYGLFVTLFMEFGSPLVATREVSRLKNNNASLINFVSSIFSIKLALIPFVCILSTIFTITVPIFSNNSDYLIIVILGSISQGLSPIWYFQGKRNMKIISISKIVFRSLGFLLIFLNVDSSNDGWIVLGALSLSSIFIGFFLFFAMINETGVFRITFSKKTKEIFLKSNLSFIITIIPIIYQNVSVVILSLFVSPLQLGIYYGANMIYRALNSLYGPLSQSFFPIISSIEKKDKKLAWSVTKKYFLSLTTLGLLFFLIIYFKSDYVISVLLGDQFSGSNDILTIFAFVLPLTAISNSIGRQWLMYINKDLFYAITQFVASIIAFTLFLFLVQAYGIFAMPISLIGYEAISIIIISSYLLKNFND